MQKATKSYSSAYGGDGGTGGNITKDRIMDGIAGNGYI